MFRHYDIRRSINMNTENIELLSIGAGIPASMLWLPFAAVVLFFALCWILCVAAAFAGVEKTPFHASVIAVGIGGVTAFLSTTAVSILLPDLAREFTSHGLLFFSFVSVIPIVCVPLVQYAWGTSYVKGLASFVLALGLFFFAWTAFHTLLQPEERDTARISLPVLFQSNS